MANNQYEKAAERLQQAIDLIVGRIADTDAVEAGNVNMIEAYAKQLTAIVEAKETLARITPEKKKVSTVGPGGSTKRKPWPQ